MSTTPGATPGRRRRPPPAELVERRRQEIIEAAYEVFAAKGYSAAGIADVAERLGIGHGTFYRYFKNKRDILDRVVDYGVERFVDVLEQETFRAPRTLQEFQEQLRQVGERLFALLDAEPGLGQVVLLEATSVDEEMTRRVLGLIDAFGALAAGWLQSGVRRGFLRPDLDTDSVGRAVTSLMLPGVFAAIRGDTGVDERRRYIDAMVGLVCDGIAAS